MHKTRLGNFYSITYALMGDRLHRQGALSIGTVYLLIHYLGLLSGPLWVFDDLSSALDVETERLLWKKLLSRQPRLTCLVVSHRRLMLQQADQIILLRNGQIEATGKVDEVLAHSREMQQIWQTD